MASRCWWSWPSSSFFSSIDVAAFPSQWAEPVGLVAAEAMSSRTPFVNSDAGAPAEVAGPEHPWVTPKGDAVAPARRGPGPDVGAADQPPALSHHRVLPGTCSRPVATAS